MQCRDRPLQGVKSGMTEIRKEDFQSSTPVEVPDRLEQLFSIAREFGFPPAKITRAGGKAIGARTLPNRRKRG